MDFELKENAIFISDSHSNTNKLELYDFLLDLDKNRPKFSQIFMLGDMFDFLANTTYTQIFYEKEIELLNKISQIYEIYYFEGNHDFNLENIFPNIKIFPIQAQPVIFKTKINKTVSISHGDIFLKPFTQKSLLFLRNKTFLKFMNFLDEKLNFKISKRILNFQKDKILYKEFVDFKDYISQRLQKYSSDYIIEGHYHQDKIFEFELQNKIYINLNSYAVKNKIYISKFEENRLILKQI